jgi:AcrR family transcriptional regulator
VTELGSGKGAITTFVALQKAVYSDEMPVAKQRRRGRPAGGSVAVVSAILDAALVELGRVGYADMSIDDVARAARVNKTTIYRRWPTKADLVIAAVVAGRDEAPRFKPSGRLRDDLIVLLRAKARSVATPRQCAISHAINTLDSSVKAALLHELRRRRYTMPRDVIERAIARGELPAQTDPELVVEWLTAPIFHRALMLREQVSDTFIEQTIDVVLAGVGAKPIKQR